MKCQSSTKGKSITKSLFIHFHEMDTRESQFENTRTDCFITFCVKTQSSRHCRFKICDCCLNKYTKKAKMVMLFGPYNATHLGCNNDKKILVMHFLYL